MAWWPRRLKKFIEQKIIADWRYKLAALGAAFIFWLYIAGQQAIQAVYTVPVYFQSVPEGLILVDQSINQVEVTISGRRDRILALKERQIWVSINLAKMKVGRNQYRIKKDEIIVPPGIELKTFSPHSLMVYLALESKP